MLSSIDSCQNRVSADQYHLTVSRAQVSTHQGRVFFWSYPLTIYSFSNDRRLTFTFFKNSHQICCVYVSIALHYYDFDFKLTSDAKIQPVFLKDRRGRPLLTKVTCWSRSTSNFYALIGQNSTGEFMPIIYEVSWNLFTLTAEADRVLCQLVMFFSVFSPRCTKCNTAAIKSLLFFMAGLFIGFLVEKCVAFGWHRFFSPFLMR